MGKTITGIVLAAAIVGFAIFAVLLAILLTLILLAKKRVKSTEVKKETVTV